jgi:hypothetical protein
MANRNLRHDAYQEAESRRAIPARSGGRGTRPDRRIQEPAAAIRELSDRARDRVVRFMKRSVL